MRIRRFLGAGLLALLASTLAPVHGQTADLDATPVLEDVLHGYVRPAYDQLGDRFQALEQTTARLCETPSAEALESMRSAFDAAALAWAGIEWFRTGPAMAENRLERILFYPDRKSTGLKQVQRALRSENADVVSPKKLAQKSVAMQGLGALEYLVFGTGSDGLADASSPFRCRFAAAVASNLSTIAGELQQGWEEGQAYPALFVRPVPENPFFRDDTEALNMVLGTMIHGLEAIRDIRIGGFLREPGNDRAASAVYRRAGLTLESVAAGLAGLERLFNQSGIELVLPDGKSNLADQVRFEFNQSIRTALSLQGNLEELLADETSRQKIVYLQYSIHYIIRRLDEEFAPAAGLAAGFSFGDGD